MVMFFRILLILNKLFLLFYQNLLNGSSDTFQNISDALHFNLPCLAESDCSDLICDVTMEEVYSTLLDLPLGKSPGLDGFNVEFYRTFWPVIGEHIFAVIQYFFQNSLMPLSGVKLLLSSFRKRTIRLWLLIFVWFPFVTFVLILFLKFLPIVWKKSSLSLSVERKWVLWLIVVRLIILLRCKKFFILLKMIPLTP